MKRHFLTACAGLLAAAFATTAFAGTTAQTAQFTGASKADFKTVSYMQVSGVAIDVPLTGFYKSMKTKISADGASKSFAKTDFYYGGVMGTTFKAAFQDGYTTGARLGVASAVAIKYDIAPAALAYLGLDSAAGIAVAYTKSFDVAPAATKHDGFTQVGSTFLDLNPVAGAFGTG